MYIGQSVKILKTRKTEHISASKSAKSTVYFANALKKYGAEAFEWEVMCECAKSEMDELEELAIEMNQTLAPNGFNLRAGGSQGKSIVPSKRRDIDGSVLPPGIELVVKEGEVRGYKGHHGPTGESRAIIARRLSMPDKLAMATAWLKAKREDAPLPNIPVHNRGALLSIGLPKYIYYHERKFKKGIQKGYLVHPHGKRFTKHFKSKATLEANLADAKAFLEQYQRDIESV